MADFFAFARAIFRGTSLPAGLRRLMRLVSRRIANQASSVWLQKALSISWQAISRDRRKGDVSLLLQLPVDWRCAPAASRRHDALERAGLGEPVADVPQERAPGDAPASSGPSRTVSPA
ncbi:MAG: hypothetical protein AAFR79_11100 [Pseudomonadota bacterium]